MLPMSVLVLPRYPEPNNEPSRRVTSEDDLAAALSRLVEAPVARLEVFLRDSPAGRFLVAFQADIQVALADCSADRRIDIAAHTVDMDAKWPDVYKLLEQTQLAGAVDLRRYWEWCRHPDSDSGIGLYGLIKVAEQAGMTHESGRRYGSEHYGLLACHEHCRDLPSLLVHYLTVYEEMGLHLSPGHS